MPLCEGRFGFWVLGLPSFWNPAPSSDLQGRNRETSPWDLNLQAPHPHPSSSPVCLLANPVTTESGPKNDLTGPDSEVLVPPPPPPSPTPQCVAVVSLKWKSRDQRMQKKKAISGQQTMTTATRVKRSRTRVPSRSSGSGTWYILSDLGMEGCDVRAKESRAGTQRRRLACSVLSLALLRGWGV